MSDRAMDGTGEAGEAAGKGRARREDRDSRSVARRIFAPIRSSRGNNSKRDSRARFDAGDASRRAPFRPLQRARREERRLDRRLRRVRATPSPVARREGGASGRASRFYPRRGEKRKRSDEKSEVPRRCRRWTHAARGISPAVGDDATRAPVSRSRGRLTARRVQRVGERWGTHRLRVRRERAFAGASHAARVVIKSLHRRRRPSLRRRALSADAIAARRRGLAVVIEHPHGEPRVRELTEGHVRDAPRGRVRLLLRAPHLCLLGALSGACYSRKRSPVDSIDRR